MMELPKYQLPQLSDIAHRPVAARDDLPEARRAPSSPSRYTYRLWALASFPQRRAGQKQSDVSIAGHIADGIQAGRRADRLQPTTLALALLPGDGRARSGGGGDRHRLHLSIDAAMTEARADAGAALAGPLEPRRPRWPSSPGSCSRRSASRRSP